MLEPDQIEANTEALCPTSSLEMGNDKPQVEDSELTRQPVRVPARVHALPSEPQAAESDSRKPRRFIHLAGTVLSRPAVCYY